MIRVRRMGWVITMSELTPCNYCSLSRIKQRADKKGWQVTTKPDGHGWTAVYVHPPEIKDFPDDDNEPSEYFAASMMRITDHCVC